MCVGEVVPACLKEVGSAGGEGALLAEPRGDEQDEDCDGEGFGQLIFHVINDER